MVYMLIGFLFGYVLEISGFGNALKLAPQFYFKDLTVLKVMFGAIIVAMVLVFLSTGLGLLDYKLVYVNPTYLWPGIVGGLIMGVGFILGGFCPGTSLVSMATAKLDGIAFVGGVFFGIFLFGETVQYFEEFWYSSYLGRVTLPEILGVPTGWVVLGVVLMALFMFWGAEQLERIIGGKDPADEPKWRYYAAGLLVLGAIGTIIIGQPSIEERWAMLEDTDGARLANREVQIQPAELLDKIHDDSLNVIMLDVRDEADFNLFHILDARNVGMDELSTISTQLRAEPANTVTVLMSNDETAATEAWKTLRAESVPSVYILEGGLNNWISTYADPAEVTAAPIANPQDDQLAFTFPAALGAGYTFAQPNPHSFPLVYEPKVKLEIKRGPSGGGCG
jgi:rhodanese-related sulfurtransferase